MMKTISLLICLLGVNSVLLAQTMTENEKSIRIEYKNSNEASKIYDSLALPIDFGTEITGLKHQYKIFKDTTKSVTVYCDLQAGNSKRCLVEIFKNPSTDLVTVVHDKDQSFVELYDTQETLKLWNALNVPVMDHGGFGMKVVATEDLNMSLSCLQKNDDPDWRQCSVRILRSSDF